MNTSQIAHEGATKLALVVSPDYIPVVMQVYNSAATKTFLIALGLALAAFLSSLGMEWKSIKREENKQYE